VTTWSIGEAAAKCGLSQHTLRWYERIGLLGAIERGSDGRRRFTDRDLEWLSLLVKLRATGMPVRDMQRYAELVRSGSGHAERLELFRKHREEVLRALASQRECLELLDAKISRYEACTGPAAPEATDQDLLGDTCAPANSVSSPCPPRAWAAWG
jgi:DNA-binding transcriptional MerR regulator